MFSGHRTVATDVGHVVVLRVSPKKVLWLFYSFSDLICFHSHSCCSHSLYIPLTVYLHSRLYLERGWKNFSYWLFTKRPNLSKVLTLNLMPIFFHGLWEHLWINRTVCFSGSWAQRWISVEWSCQTWSWSCCGWGETVALKPLSSVRWRRRSRRPKACWIRRVRWVCIGTAA